jgi:hypothetical protein
LNSSVCGGGGAPTMLVLFRCLRSLSQKFTIYDWKRRAAK